MTQTRVPRGRYLRFQLADQQFGVLVDFVREVVEMVAISSVSHATPAVRGAINYRGTIVPVVSGRAWFGLPDCEVSPQHRMVLLQEGDTLTAFIVDRVLDVVELDQDVPVESRGGTGWDSHVLGIFRHDSAIVQVANIEDLCTRFRSDSA